jgi:RNA polymerase sigma factor (TIGR02999 family)
VSDVIQILNAVERGDPHAAEQLLPLVYEELRKLAAAKLAHEKPGQTLDATALVHEAYVRLVGSESPPVATGKLQFANRRHFFAAAAQAMRRILIERARRKRSRKRGGGQVRLKIDPHDLTAPERDEHLLALDEAVNKLAMTDAQAAELVQLRFFAGLPLAEVAEILGVSARSADRLWAYARAWLRQEMRKE